MGRPHDKQAGYTLLEAVNNMNIKLPYIIYARGGNEPENKRETRSRGAYDSISGARELFPTVISALENR